MPKVKRPVRERTEDWTQLRLLVTWPEQMAYELIRPVVLYGETAAERARETGENERTIDRKADRFDQQGMHGSIRPEYDAMLLSMYSFEFEADGRHIREVRNPRLVDTPFRSPQLLLFDPGPDEWLLYLRAPDYSPRRRGHSESLLQLQLEPALLASR